MSNMKNGFSTLNRWLGKNKNKDKAATPNGKLSKSSNNLSLSVSNTNINETSQLEYNRITPLPVATSNAPFEQTFRITVLLPKDQLYVARLGARVPLSKLLELVCENKQLDADKYEFRNPVDHSQTYSCDLTIGAVGLSEIRLCHKSEDYDNFNTDEVIKSLHRSAIIRDSLSSSEFSSRNSKHTTKTASPYSSSNSLNSMDSTGMNYTRSTPVGPPPAAAISTAATQQSKLMMAPPPRKKRAAPRPPSQVVIPEQSALVMNGNENTPTPRESEVTLRNEVGILPPPSRKDFYVSAPNLATSTTTLISNNSVDCNGNSNKSNQNHNGNQQQQHSDDDDQQQLNESQVEEKNARNLYTGSVQDLATEKLPEPSPRKRIFQIKKKTAAPAPPPRESTYADDAISLTSLATPDAPSTPPPTPATPISPGMPTVSPEANSTINGNTTPPPPPAEIPKPTARETVVAKPTPLPAVVAIEIKEPTELPINIPKPVPRITTTAQINAAPSTAEKPEINEKQNVSKVLLNRTPTPEPRSLSTEPPDMPQTNDLKESQTILLNGECTTQLDDDDAASKQADSGIGEPVPSPLPDSLPPSDSSAIDGKSSNFESSSDDDDMVKVYNFKLGKTLVKPIEEHPAQTLEDLTALAAAEETTEDELTSGATTVEATPVSIETTSWNFQIPILPPPNFADDKKSADAAATAVSDAPIMPKITERPVLNFATIAVAEPKPKAVVEAEDVKAAPVRPQQLKLLEKPIIAAAPTPSPATPMSDIVDELSTLINEKRMDTLIKKADDAGKIESAKPNTLSNFSIAAHGVKVAEKPKTEPLAQITKTAAEPAPSSPDSVPEEDKLYRKRGSITNGVSSNLLKQQRRSINRADSFHTTLQSSLEGGVNGEHSAINGSTGLSSRSSSYLSLTKIEQNGLALNRRRSSSELSIGESPSLQSLEVIKTILNSRKNSLNNSSGSGSDGESKTASIEILNRIETLPTTVMKTVVTTTRTALPAVDSVEESNAEVALRPKTTVEQPTKAEEEKSTAKLKEETLTRIEKSTPKELPKVYRYSGPPSINFSTWSERPKVQVSIKNEGDYIFGGKNANSPSAAVTTAAVEIRPATNTGSMPRSYRRTVAAAATEDFRDFKFRNDRKPIQTEELKISVAQATESVLAAQAEPAAAAATPTPTPPPAVAPKPFSTTVRMGIPEKQYVVPITVKPLKDVIITGEDKPQVAKEDSVSNKTITTGGSGNISKTVIVNNEHFGAKSLETSQTTQATTTITTKTTHAQLRPVSQVATAFNTLPRTNNNRFSTPALAGPAILRSTSITKQEECSKPQTAVEATAAAPAPFGQNTLRKTGFKEKMLAKEEAEKQQLQIANGNLKSTVFVSTQKSTLNSTQPLPAQSQTVTRTSITLQNHTNSTQQNSTQTRSTTLQSAKLELKLQKSTSVYVQPTSSPVTPVVSTPKSAPVAPPVPPPAPKLPTLKPVTANKAQSSSTASNGGGDPRDQLLAAIRNFKREELNRS